MTESNHSVERSASDLRPPAAAHLKRLGVMSQEIVPLREGHFDGLRAALDRAHFDSYSKGVLRQ